MSLCDIHDRHSCHTSCHSAGTGGGFDVAVAAVDVAVAVVVVAVAVVVEVTVIVIVTDGMIVGNVDEAVIISMTTRYYDWLHILRKTYRREGQ